MTNETDNDLMLQCFRLKIAQRARQIGNTPSYDRHMIEMVFNQFEYVSDLLDLINLGLKIHGEDYLDQCIKDLASETRGDDNLSYDKD